MPQPSNRRLATEAYADTAKTTAQGTSLQKTANLSDVASAATARTNLGLGTAATQPTTAFDASGAAAGAQAAAVQRANHTGTQAATTITGLATVATSGAYTDLSAKPTIPAAQTVAATTSTAGALTINAHNPVDATSGAKTMTLPTGQAQGTIVSVEKVDASANAVAITGSIRGVGSSSLSLVWQFESLTFIADSSGSWWPRAGHKTKASLDAAFVAQVSGLAAGTGADNAAVIQAAIDAATAAGGGAVRIPRGTWTTGPLVMKSFVRLTGEGWGTTLRLKDGANAHMVTLAAGTQRIKIDNLRFDGNKANQTAGDILHFDSTGYDGSGTASDAFDDDPNMTLHRVELWHAFNDGLYLLGLRGAGQYELVYAMDNGRDGFHSESPDNEFLLCTAGNNGGHGFFLGGTLGTGGSAGNNRVMNSDSWLSGRTNGATRGDGYRLESVARVDVVECSAQDNRGTGFVVNSGTQVKLSGRAERNGMGLGGNPYGQGDGIAVTGTVNSRFDVLCTDRNVGSQLVQRYGYNNGTGNSGNVVDIVVDQALTGAGAGSWGTGSVVRGLFQGKTFGSGTAVAATDSPLSQGMLAWPYEAVLASGFSALPTGGFPTWARMVVQQDGTSPGLYIYINTAATAATVGSQGACLVDANGNQIAKASSATVEAQISGTGLKLIAWDTPPALSAGQVVYAAIWFNGTTGPSIGRQGLANPGAFVPAGVTRRFGGTSALTTTAPSSINLSTMTAPGTALFWYAI